MGKSASRSDFAAGSETPAGEIDVSLIGPSAPGRSQRDVAFRRLSTGVLAFLAGVTAAFAALPGMLEFEGSWWSGSLLPAAGGIPAWWLGWGLAGVPALVYAWRLRARARTLANHNQSLARELAVQRDDGEQARFLAYHDPLTRLPNREFFREQLAEASAQAAVEGCQIAVMLVDLDGFKEVNDRLGHAQGDCVLQKVARRLANCVRAVDSISRGRLAGPDRMVSRIGGDEFTILLAHIRNHEEAAIVARRILQSLREALDLGGREVHIGASIGIAIYPSEETDGIDGLLRNADMAMYHAKQCGRNNYQFFDESLNDAAQRRSALAGELRRAFEQGDFSLVFQPIAATHTGHFVALEALLRWDHPEKGRLGAGEFVQIAEETGLMASLGGWVLDESCRLWSHWRDAGLPDLRLCVNVSGLQLRSDDLPGAVERVLEKYGIPGKQLELEITESAMMEDEEEASRTLESLKRQGVRISLDDFGTGYSSLSYVKRFPVDTIKIDRSFVQGVIEDPEARAITSAIVALAHELGLSVVAEGVENAAQQRCLTELRCDEMQGFWLCEPLESEAVERFLSERVAEPIPAVA